jgi:hypothetical protein
MLHDREPAQLGQLASQSTSRRRGIPEQVKQAATPRAGQSAPQIRFRGADLSYPS